MDIVVYTEGLAFDGRTPFEQSLGGSESAVVFMSRELARRGHGVRVFCNRPMARRDSEIPPYRADECDGVVYHDLTGFREFVERGECDVFVCCRHLRGLTAPVRSKVNVLWNHDVMVKPAAAQVMSLMYKVDRLFVLSEFHKEQFQRHLAVPDDRYVVTRNGVDLGLVDDCIAGVHRDPSRVFYTSRPERGLDVLLSVWPEMKARRSDLKLAIAHYENPAADAQMAEYVGTLRRFGEQFPDVEFLGPLSKGALYAEIARSALVVYPSSFPEVSCISMIEAAACGTPVVTSRYCALKETVADGESGVLVPGDPHEEEYQRRFVDAVIGLMEDGERREEMGRAARRRVEERYRWSAIAEEWEAIFRGSVERESVKGTPPPCPLPVHGEGEAEGTVGAGMPLPQDGRSYRSCRAMKAKACGTHGVAGAAAPVQQGDARPMSGQECPSQGMAGASLCPTRQSLSVCMIVKDAQGALYRCLDSVKDIADEIIVCDTGSTDRTMAIAREYTDQVYEIPWEDDFAAARNRSIERATKDWVLWIDADEALIGAEQLSKYLRPNMYNGYVIRQHHYAIDADFKPDVPVRLFRNGMGIRFFGCVHEHPETALNEGVQPSVILSDVHIMHDGYVTESVRRKRFLRNLPMVLKDRKLHPNRRLGLIFLERDYIHLARYDLERTHGQMTERARKYLERAAAVHREHFADPSDPLYGYSFPLYQSALELMGEGFEVGYFLEMGAGGKLLPYGEVRRVRVADEAEGREFMARQVAGLMREAKAEEEFTFE